MKNFIMSVIGIPVFWTLFDLLYAKLISKEAFHFTILGNLIIPVVVGAIVGYFMYLRKKDK